MAVVRPVVLPNTPTGQLTQAPAPPVLYCPTGQMVAVALVDPAGHAYPGAHAPLHALVVSAGVPQRPAAQGPSQVDTVRPPREPYCERAIVTTNERTHRKWTHKCVCTRMPSGADSCTRRW